MNNANVRLAHELNQKVTPIEYEKKQAKKNKTDE